MDEKERGRAVESLRLAPARVADLIAGAVSGALTRKPSPAEFSARENIHHLRDIEVEGYAVRLRRMLEEPCPDLPDMDGDRLSRERRYNDRPHEEALEEFARTRRECVGRLAALSAQDWQRIGRLEGMGTLSVETLVGLWCAHDRGHLEELERLLGADGGR